ncbi:hypothetical protein C823_007664 [Eubacterium plexicaudatum ASF492]|nr:hypothetical protein C823_007664 [Eubacterium plexicaudatum ASF492]
MDGVYADLDVGGINQVFKNAGVEPLGLITTNEKIKEAIEANKQLLYSYKRQLETDFKSSASQNISPMIEKYLGTNEDFQKLDENLQNEIKQITKI